MAATAVSYGLGIGTWVGSDDLYDKRIEGITSHLPVSSRMVTHADKAYLVTWDSAKATSDVFPAQQPRTRKVRAPLSVLGFVPYLSAKPYIEMWNDTSVGYLDKLVAAGLLLLVPLLPNDAVFLFYGLAVLFIGVHRVWVTRSEGFVKVSFQFSAVIFAGILLLWLAGMADITLGYWFEDYRFTWIRYAALVVPVVAAGWCGVHMAFWAKHFLSKGNVASRLFNDHKDKYAQEMEDEVSGKQ